MIRKARTRAIAQKVCNFADMKKAFITVGLLLGLALTGCGNRHSASGTDYTVTCRLDGVAQHDSATLLVLEEEYHQLRVCGTTRLKDGACSFAGQVDGPHVAMIRWDNDSVGPFIFVLEHGDINITIKPGSWSITGSPMNSRYLHYINQRNAIMDARLSTWQDYLKQAADKSLTRAEEVRLVKQDSLLNDSLLRLTKQHIDRGDAVGSIIRERYGEQPGQKH